MQPAPLQNGPARGILKLVIRRDPSAAEAENFCGPYDMAKPCPPKSHAFPRIDRCIASENVLAAHSTATAIST
jgi:hypothetical protein